MTLASAINLLCVGVFAAVTIYDIRARRRAAREFETLTAISRAESRELLARAERLKGIRPGLRN